MDTVLVIWTQVVLAAVLAVMGVRTIRPVRIVRIDHQYRSAPVMIVTVVLSVMLQRGMRDYQWSRRVRFRYDSDIVVIQATGQGQGRPVS